MKTERKSYHELKDMHPEMVECFFAFSKQQFEEGVKKAGIEGKKIYDAGYGLYGTNEGIKKFMAFYDDVAKRISKECDPQEVYNYEFGNHECDYTCTDEEAIKIVLDYFGYERTKKVRRRYGYYQFEPEILEGND